MFLNACEAGDSGWTLTKIGGWADAFCDVGFSGFIGPYWPVSDMVAGRAAHLFYEELSAEATVGEAVRALRQRFYTDDVARGHPSWISYTLHCQPNIHVQMPAAD